MKGAWAGIGGLVLAAGCARNEDVQWLEGFGFGWTAFNHRVSHIEVGLASEAAFVAVVGGTSTTGEASELSAACAPEYDVGTCAEFPFVDTYDADVWTGRARGRLARGSATVDLLVSAEGASAQVRIPFDRRARGEAIALLHGLRLDTDAPLASGPACYDPANGWHPRRMAIAVGEPIVSDDGREATVTVEASFEAGNSLEAVRQCIDAVAADARVVLSVEVLVVAGDGRVETRTVAHEASWPDGVPQPEPDPATRPLDLPIDGPLGWGRIDFAFHVDDPGDRGAYLRTWSFRLDAIGGSASGHATNHSPGTQLSGFDYRFTGEARVLSLGLEVERRVARAEELGIALADDGPVPSRIPLGPR